MTSALALTVAAAAFGPGVIEDPLMWWPPREREAQERCEQVLLQTPEPENLSRLHDLFGSEPHVAGTPGDARVIERMTQTFEAMGLEVEQHWIDVYLSYPVSASLEIVSPLPQTLPVAETPLPEDPATADPALPPGFNAYSASGQVEGTVVYANYGRREDFQKLRELGVDLTGRIVIARYGGNYRGFKARFAEEAGAAGLIIYTDPDDSGYRKGLPYPEGGYANDSSIQRGSIVTLPQPGDPLTPFVEATVQAERLDEDDVDLPRIPVQPVGWGAAQQIMSRMTGRPLPPELIGSWQGGLPFAYRLEGGDDLRVRLDVRQERKIARTANVIARLKGVEHPQEEVILGCHHDAWGHGASDPLAGLIVLFESARSFSEAARQGHRPRRTIVFAAWAAEEYGIIGSTEYCEARAEDLAANAIAYLNLDMAAMGPDFRASAAPLLQSVILGAAATVPQAGGGQASVLRAWAGPDENLPDFGTLGGGSDHVGFYCHLGIPSAGLGAGGSHGVSYHSAYDTIHWYRQVVGDDYTPARMITQMANIIAGRLAHAPLLPLDPRSYAASLRRHLEDLASRASEQELTVDLIALNRAVDELEEAWSSAMPSALESVQRESISAEDLAQLNGILRTLERRWLDGAGLPDRPWYRSLYAATDPYSGYAAWPLPALRQAIEEADEAAVSEAARRTVEVLRLIADDAGRLREAAKATVTR